MKLIPSITDRLRTQHLVLDNILLTVSSQRLVLEPAPGKWNIHDNIAHLARYQPVFIDRVHQILRNDLPSFGRYSAEEDPEFPHWQMEGTDSLTRRLHADRIILHDLVIQLPADQLMRSGVHKKFGSLTIIEWTEFFLLHEAHHIFTIFQLAHNTEL